jgi:hypothetical protein
VPKEKEKYDAEKELEADITRVNDESISVGSNS